MYIQCKVPKQLGWDALRVPSLDPRLNSCCPWDVWAPRVQPPSSCWSRLSHTQSFPAFPCPHYPFLTFGSFPKHPIVSHVKSQNALHPIRCPITQGSVTSNPKGRYLGSLPCLCLHGSFLWVCRQAFNNKLTLSSFHRDWSRSSHFWETEIPRAKCLLLNK